MKSLEEILEDIKLQGHYGIRLIYGEDVGCDDIYVEHIERNIKIIAVPVGCLGGSVKLWTGTLEELKNFDYNKKPTRISNPPKFEEYGKTGHYIWGTDDAVRNYI